MRSEFSNQDGVSEQKTTGMAPRPRLGCGRVLRRTTHTSACHIFVLS